MLICMRTAPLLHRAENSVVKISGGWSGEISLFSFFIMRERQESLVPVLGGTRLGKGGWGATTPAPHADVGNLLAQGCIAPLSEWLPRARRMASRLPISFRIP